jgi:hypothetical protein
MANHSGVGHFIEVNSIGAPPKTSHHISNLSFREANCFSRSNIHSPVQIRRVAHLKNQDKA